MVGGILSCFFCNALVGSHEILVSDMVNDIWVNVIFVISITITNRIRYLNKINRLAVLNNLFTVQFILEDLCNIRQ